MRDAVRLAGQDRVDQRGHAVFLGRGADRVEVGGLRGARRLRAGVEIERQLLHFRPGEADVEIGGARNALGHLAVEAQARRVGELAHRLADAAQVRRVEHAHHSVLALLDQLCGARLVGRPGRDDDHRTRLPPARIAGADQRIDRLQRLLALRAHEDVACIAEQRGGTRLVAQQRGVATQLRSGEVHALARIGQQLGDFLRGGGGTGFVRAAEEEDRTVAGELLGLPGEIALGGLHSPSRRRRATRVTMRSARSFERFSSARCSAAMVAYSLETTSIPASEAALASSTISPLARSTSW